MNRKLIKVSHIFMDSQCCICGTTGLGQFSNLKDNHVNLRGSLVSYVTIVETTLNYHVPIDENLEICDSCKNTIISFYLLKTKFDEACQQSNSFNYEDQHENIEKEPVEQPPIQIKQEFDDGAIQASFKESALNYGELDQSAAAGPDKRKKRRPERIQWKDFKEFQTSEEALEYVKNQKIWSVKHTKPLSKSGEKRQYFRCNLVPKAQARQCSSVMALVTKSDGTTTMLQSQQSHDHSLIINNLNKTE